MTRQKLNSFRSNQIEVSYLVLVSKSKEMCRKFPEIRSLSYFKRINGLEFWCLQIPLKVVTFWDEPKLAKSCPANFVPLKKFRVQNNEHVTPSVKPFQIVKEKHNRTGDKTLNFKRRLFQAESLLSATFSDLLETEKVVFVNELCKPQNKRPDIYLILFHSILPKRVSKFLISQRIWTNWT